MSNYSWPSSWNAIPAPLSQETAAAFVERCFDRRSVILGNLHDLSKAGHHRKFAKMAAAYLTCGSVRVAALARAVRRKDVDWSAKELLAEARELNLYKPCDERVIAKFEERQNNRNPRLVVSFGPRELARQLIAKDVLELCARLHPNQFACQGGMDAIQVWLHQELPKYTHVLTTDFPCFFPNLNRKLVKETVLLPQTVLNELLFAPMERMEAKKHPCFGIPITQEQLCFDVCGVRPGWGIPPGSALSSLAAECALCPILEAVEEKVQGIQVAVYADNLIILANSREVAEASKDALSSVVAEYFHTLVVDELRSRSRIDHVEAGFKFLGYDFLLSDGVVNQNIDKERFEMFIDRIQLDWFEDPLDPAFFDRAERRILGYEHAHRFAANAKAMSDKARSFVRELSV